MLVQAKCRTMPHETAPGNHCHTRVLSDTYAATFCSKTAAQHPHRRILLWAAHASSCRRHVANTCLVIHT